MGLTEIQKEMIRGIATNNILKARQGALGALNDNFIICLKRLFKGKTCFINYPSFF